MKIKKTSKHAKHNNKRNFLLLFLTIFLIILIIYIVYNVSTRLKDKEENQDLQKEIVSSVTEENNISTATMEKVKELQEENADVKGWIRIEGTNINYPLLQGEDNDYYLNRDYKKETSSYGSIYIDCNSDLNNNDSNVIIYGHSMKDKEMFRDLLEYTSEDYYNEHKTIQITTNNEELNYEIVTVFKSRVFYKDETDVFRYYYYTDLSNEEKYNYYIENCKELELYNTGIDAKYGEQLITLITCEYSEENGRMVVVAKRVQ